MMKDEELVKIINTKASELNKLLNSAANSGIKVKIDIFDTTSLGYSVKCKTLGIRCFKFLGGLK